MQTLKRREKKKVKSATERVRRTKPHLKVERKEVTFLNGIVGIVERTADSGKRVGAKRERGGSEEGFRASGRKKGSGLVERLRIGEGEERMGSGSH